MLIGDEELNFTDEEARAIDRVRGAPTRRRNRADDEGDGRLLAGFAGALLLSFIFVFIPTHSHSGSSPRAAQSSDISQQSSSDNQQTAQPEYFPAGWSYIKA